jgi:hypothetical protein
MKTTEKRYNGFLDRAISFFTYCDVAYRGLKKSFSNGVNNRPPQVNRKPERQTKFVSKSTKAGATAKRDLRIPGTSSRIHNVAPERKRMVR